MTLEDWSNSTGWKELPRKVRKELQNGELIEGPDSPQYDAVLTIWLTSTLESVTNEYLANQLNIEKVSGEVPELEPCPCCGYRTIGERGNFEICRICWWEDDGQDNENADTVMGGPNYELSLTKGRLNFLIHGISDPNRTDLIELQDPPRKYAAGRKFQIVKDFVIEEGADWKGLIKTDA